MMSPSDLLATLVLNAFQNSSGRIVLQSEKGRRSKRNLQMCWNAWCLDQGLEEGLKASRGGLEAKREGGLKGNLKAGLQKQLKGKLKKSSRGGLRGASVKI